MSLLEQHTYKINILITIYTRLWNSFNVVNGRLMSRRSFACMSSLLALGSLWWWRSTFFREVGHLCTRKLMLENLIGGVTRNKISYSGRYWRTSHNQVKVSDEFQFSLIRADTGKARYFASVCRSLAEHFSQLWQEIFISQWNESSSVIRVHAP